MSSEGVVNSLIIKIHLKVLIQRLVDSSIEINRKLSSVFKIIFSFFYRKNKNNNNKFFVFHPLC